MINKREYYLISSPYNICLRNLIKSSFSNKQKKKIIFFSPQKKNLLNKIIKKKYNIVNSYNYCITGKIFRGIYFVLSSIETNLVIKKKKWPTMSLIKRRFTLNKDIEPIILHDYSFLNSFICNFITSIKIIYILVNIILFFLLFIFSLKYLIIIFFYKPKKILFLHAHANQDKGLLIIAKLFKIKTCALISSWDNPTTKLVLPVKFDTFFSWNKFNKREICYLNNIKKKDVLITGVPQYDNYNYFIRNKKKFKNNYKKKFNIGSKKIICLFMPSLGFFNLDTQKKIIIKIYEKLAIIDNYFLHVRLHPGTEISGLNYNNFCKSKIYFEYPEKITIANSSKDILKFSETENNSLEKVLVSSDITINFSSTTSIDAAYFDKPIINLNLNMDNNDTISWFYKFSHYKQLTKFNGTSFCKDFNSVFASIDKYIKNAKYKKDGRQLIKKYYCHYNDSLSGTRISNTFFNE